MERCKLDNYYPKSVCKFAVKSCHNLDRYKLQEELRDRSHPDIQVSKVRAYTEGTTMRHREMYVFAITFPLNEPPLEGDLTIDKIVEHLDVIELDVEKALRIKKLAEMVK